MGSSDAGSLDSVIPLAIGLFVAVFIIPVIRCIYRKYVSIALKIAGEKLEEVHVRVTETLQDAGRKASEKMRA